MNPDNNSQPPQHDHYTPPNQPLPTPVMSEPGATPPPLPTSSRKPSRTIFVILGAVLLVLGIAALVVFLIASNQPDDDQTNGTATPTASLSEAEQTITALRATVNEATTTPASGYETVEGDFSAAPTFARTALLSGDETFAVFPTESYGFAAFPTANNDAQAIESRLISALTDASYTQLDQQGTSNDQEAYTRFSDDTTLCTIYRNNGSEQTSPATVTAGCANRDDFTASFESARPFAISFLANRDSDIPADTVPIFDTIAIRDSETEGYQVADVLIRSYPFGQLGYAASFYRAEGSDWLFFNAGQNVPLCSDYTTDDLRKAFAGTSCAGTSSTETVQP